MISDGMLTERRRMKSMRIGDNSQNATSGIDSGDCQATITPATTTVTPEARPPPPEPV